MLRLAPRPTPLVPDADNERFFDLVVKTFRNPRKHLHNSLAMGVTLGKASAGEALARAGIDAMRRPETLTIAEWLDLLRATEEVRQGA